MLKVMKLPVCLEYLPPVSIQSSCLSGHNCMNYSTTAASAVAYPHGEFAANGDA
jgi:hypothetical protein